MDFHECNGGCNQIFNCMHTPVMKPHLPKNNGSMPKYKICILLLFQTCFFVVDEFLTPYVSDGKGRACVLACLLHVRMWLNLHVLLAGLFYNVIRTSPNWKRKKERK